MIEEKRLLKMMDKAYKSGGYLLVNGEKGIELVKEGEWRFGLNRDKVSAKIKAKLVEHMDFLPEIRAAWMVRPDGVQTMDMMTALQECGAWVPKMTLQVQETDICFGSLVIYQNEGTGVCAAIPSSWLLCAGENNVLVDTLAGICYKSEEGESACGVCATKRTEATTERALKLNAVLLALEKTKLVGADAGEQAREQLDLLAEEDADDAEE